MQYACAGLLAHQGLRGTIGGGHVVIEDVVKAQFGAGFSSYGMLRRRRHELRYPRIPEDEPDAAEVEESFATVLRLIDAAESLLPSLGVF